MKQPTREEFKAWAAANRPLALAVAKAQAFAEMEKERTLRYTRPIFESYHFTEPDGTPIKDEERLYLCKDKERCKRYYDECDKAHRAHGFTGKYGHHPALIAETMKMRAENELIKSGCALLGIEGIHNLDHRKEMLRILMGACFAKEKRAA